MRLACIFLVILCAAVAIADGNAPDVKFTSVPRFGSANGVVQGRVTGVDPSGHKAAVYIFLPGLGWFSKPTCTGGVQDLVVINPDGSFTAAIVTGGVDSQATEIRVYVVPGNFEASCVLNGGGIPPATEQASVARAVVDRPNVDQKAVVFAGRRWLVKSSTVPVGPGPNIFDVQNAFVDDQNRLHLRIHYTGTNWTCAEVYLQDSLGYGRYQFTVESAVDTVPGNAVLGFFTWSNDPAQTHREIDIEFGFNKSGDPTNAQYVVQPWDVAGNLQRFQVPSGAGTTRHQFVWQPGRIDFSSSAGDRPISQWTTTQNVPTPGDEVVHLNAWLENGNPPANGQETEVILSDFSFTPLNANAVPPRMTRIVNAASYGPHLAPGSLFSIFGSNFSSRTVLADSVPLPVSLGDVRVSINNAPAPLLLVSPTQINGQIPYAAPTGTATITVRSTDVSSDALAFQIDAAAPGTFLYGANRCVAGNSDGLVGPDNAARSGSYATIYLSGQGAVDNPVATGAAAPAEPLSRPVMAPAANIGGENATLRFFGLAPFMVGVVQANVLIPPLPLGDHEFIVTMGQFTSNPCLLRAGDESIRPAPQVLAVVPLSGPTVGGTTVTVYGRNFVDGALVQFGSSAFAPAKWISPSSLQVTTPPGSAGATDVVVKNPDSQTGVLRSAFTYSAPPAPRIARIDPASGPTQGGTLVTLYGENFQSGMFVRFGVRTAAKVTVTSANEAQAATPEGAAGSVDVQVANPDGQAAILHSAFTYVMPAAPRLSSITPNSGPAAGGASVTLTGANFVAGMQVRFGASQATSVVVVGGTLATVSTPAGSGTVDVQVINPDGQSALLKGAFTYVSAAPTLTASIQGCRVSGRVFNVTNPTAVKVVVYAATNLLYLQPCVTEPLQNVSSNGSWGPVDLHSGAISAILVKAGYNPSATLGDFPVVDGINVFAVVTAGQVSGCDVARCPAR